MLILQTPLVRTAECHPFIFPFCHAKWQFPDITQWITKLQKLENNKMFSAIILNIILKTSFLVRN